MVVLVAGPSILHVSIVDGSLEFSSKAEEVLETRGLCSLSPSPTFPSSSRCTVYSTSIDTTSYQEQRQKISNADVICAAVIRRSALVLVRLSALSAAPSFVFDLFTMVST